jgi:hypothetical protein
VVPVVLGQSGSQDRQIKGLFAQGILHLLAAFRLGDVVSGLFNRNRLCGKDFRVSFAVKIFSLVEGLEMFAIWCSGRPFCFRLA